MDVGKLLTNKARGREGGTIVLAHGAGALMDTSWMNTVAEGLAGQGLRVVRFEFPYMQVRRAKGVRKGPDRPEVLLETWRAVIEKLGGGKRLVIGGKSMGGRIASMVADEVGARGVVCLGYPFHPPGKPTQLRTKHLESLKTPMLIVQGERDAFGSRAEVRGYKLSKKIGIAWIADGDHSLKRPKKSGLTEQQGLEQVVSLVADFVANLP